MSLSRHGLDLGDILAPERTGARVHRDAGDQRVDGAVAQIDFRRHDQCLPRYGGIGEDRQDVTAAAGEGLGDRTQLAAAPVDKCNRRSGLDQCGRDVATAFACRPSDHTDASPHRHSSSRGPPRACLASTPGQACSSSPGKATSSVAADAIAASYTPIRGIISSSVTAGLILLAIARATSRELAVDELCAGATIGAYHWMWVARCSLLLAPVR